MREELWIMQSLGLLEKESVSPVRQISTDISNPHYTEEKFLILFLNK